MGATQATARRRVAVPFTLNVLVILLATCWLPLTSVRATMSLEDGTVVEETVRNIPLYESYRSAVTTRNANHLRAVAMHWGMAVGITALVWTVLLRGGRRAADAESDHG